jgi:hypothetical protein
MNNEALALLMRIDDFFWPPDLELVKEAELIEEIHEFIADNYDPTPWCSSCGAMRKANCDCGPIADND